MKGIILAGGAGTRLYPMTKLISKQLQPIYDKPMIYYPISLLMLAGINEILIISTERDTPHIVELLGDGSNFGITLNYKVQKNPNGLAEAFIIGEKFIGSDDVTLILGDNLFYGDINFFKDAVKSQTQPSPKHKAQVFGYYVDDPRRYGVVEFDKDNGTAISIEEKPDNPKSHYAIPGLYIFDHQCIERAKVQKPSHRGELEITDLISTYLDDNELGVQIIGRGVNWLDTGTVDSLLEASNLIGQVQQRQGLKVACLEEIALNQGFITPVELNSNIQSMPKSPYKNYLENILKEHL